MIFRVVGKALGRVVGISLSKRCDVFYTVSTKNLQV